MFEVLGLNVEKPLLRALCVMLPRIKWTYGVPTVQMGVKQLAREAFNGDKGNASKCLRKLVDIGLLEVISHEKNKKTRVYRVVIPHEETTTQDNAQGLSKSPDGVVAPHVETATNHTKPNNKPAENGGGAVCAPTVSARCPKCGAEIMEGKPAPAPGVYEFKCKPCDYLFMASLGS